MEFLVEFEVTVPDGTVASEVKDREEAEASAATTLADEGHLLGLETARQQDVVGLYRAEDDSPARAPARHAAATRVDGRHREGARAPSQRPCGRCREPTGADDAWSLPGPWPEPVYRLDATLAAPLTSALRTGPPSHRPSDRRELQRPRDGGSCSPVRAPTGRSSCRTARRSATSATPSETDEGTCFCPVTKRPPRQRRRPRSSRPGRGRRPQRVHVPHLHPDRDRRPRPGLAEQGRLRQRGRSPGRPASSTRPTWSTDTRPHPWRPRRGTDRRTRGPD